jgi:succinyl-diaminopimelate desuccinylase
MPMNLDSRVEARLGELVEAIGQSVRIRSVWSRPEHGMPYGRKIAEALDHALQVSSSLGFRTRNLEGRVGFAEAGEGEETIAVVGHLDVVPEGSGWSFDPFGGGILDGKLCGRGTQDDKGPIFSALFALKALEDHGHRFARRVRIIFGTDEERGTMEDLDFYRQSQKLPVWGFTPDGEYPVVYAEKGLLKVRGTKRFDREIPRALCLSGGFDQGTVPERAEAVLSLSRKEEEVAVSAMFRFASLHGWDLRIQYLKEDRLRVYMGGTSAHASMPWLGANAIVRLVHCLCQAELPGETGELLKWLKRGFRDEGCGLELGLDVGDNPLGDLTCTLTTMRMDAGGIEFDLDIRYPARSRSGFEIRDKLEERFREQGISIEVRRSLDPLYVDPGSELISALGAAYEKVTGEPPRLLAMNGTTYAKKLPGLVPFGALFPGEPDLAHQADECVPISSLAKSTRIYAEALRLLTS